MKKFILAVSLLFAASVAHADDMLGPDALIKNTAEDVLSIVKQDKDLQAGDKQKLIALVEAKVLPHFDFDRMTRLAVGRGWRTATPDQRKQLVEQFRTLLVRTYTNAFTRFQNQTVDVKTPKYAPTDEEVTVRTTINKPGAQSISVDYEMEKTASGWKAFDLTVEGASLVSTYRGSFDDQIRQSGIDGLIKSLIEKNQQAAVKAGK
ncbi:MAG: ABC transporter substrate-binding protein [Gallionellaceae bacterium]|jgi:phospholipid transport system substrate-binding protein|nr:ABC transporter substrate-binding protein [Gallionellaceae bacterium]